MVNDKFYNRRWLIIILTLLILFIYIIRLINLQILSPNYKKKADNNAYYIKSVYPERGIIKDRNGSILVSNAPTSDLMVVMIQVENLDTLALSQILNIPISDIRQRFNEIKDRRKNRGYSPYVPQLMYARLPQSIASKFREQLYKFNGFFIQNRSIRRYEYHHAASILGYMSESNQKDLDDDVDLSPGDYIGRSGVERTYERQLRGIKGKEILLRDARGHIKGRYNNGQDDTPAIQGHDITLSIDTALQNLGESLMKGKRGGIVAIQPKTGEILALVDGPSYDPAMLSVENLKNNIKLLDKTPGKPLYPRSIMGIYPPGSTFKLSQAAIFLKEGVITPTTMFSCHNGYPLLGGRPRCHSHLSPISLIPAIATSCNSYFSYGLHYLLDDRKYYDSPETALTHWKDWLVKMGFGYKLGVDLPGEKRGYIPNSSVYDKLYKGRWNSSSIISIAIGQGEILATPLQIANLGAIIANRGYFYTPHVVKEVNEHLLDTTYTKKRETGIPNKIWETVVSGMAQAVTSGTCRFANFAPSKVIVCGKTGTAQNPHGKDHSAFVGFAPKDNPEIVVAVYIQNGGFGATFGVPIGRLMMEHYLNHGNLSNESKDIRYTIENKSILYFNE